MFPFTMLTQDVINHLLPGQRSMQDTLLASDTEVVTSGALSILLPISDLSVTGTQAFTLADGPAGVAGLRKLIRCTVAATSPAGTLTIASPETTAGMICSSTFYFDTVGQGVELVWSGTKWRCVRTMRAGGPVDGLVVGTTVTTAKFNLWATYLLSVTGTVSSTIAANRGIPNGSAPGEVMYVGCSTAASTPAGTIQLFGSLPGSATAGTRTLATFGATTNYMSFLWVDDTRGWVKTAEGVTVTYA